MHDRVELYLPLCPASIPVIRHGQPSHGAPAGCPWRAFEAVQFGDRGNEAQTESGSARFSRSVRPVVSPENRFQFILGDAVTIVSDHQRNAIGGALSRHLDASARGSVLEGVVQEISRAPGQAIPSPPRQATACRDAKSSLSRPLQRRARTSRPRRGNVREIERSKPRAPRARLDLTDAQQRVERFEDVSDLVDRGFDLALVDVSETSSSRMACSRRSTFKRGLRRSWAMTAAAMLVRQQQLFDPVEHAVQSPRKRGKLIVDRRARDPAAQVADRNLCAVAFIDSTRRRTCELSQRPPAVPTTAVDPIARPNAQRMMRNRSSERCCSSPTTRRDPSGSRETKARTSSGPSSGSSSASASSKSVQPPCSHSGLPTGTTSSPVRSFPSGLSRPYSSEPPPEPRAWMIAQASHGLFHEHSLKSVPLFGHPLIEIGLDAVTKREIHGGAQQDCRNGEQEDKDQPAGSWRS